MKDKGGRAQTPNKASDDVFTVTHTTEASYALCGKTKKQLEFVLPDTVLIMGLLSSSLSLKVSPDHQQRATVSNAYRSVRIWM